MKIHFHWVWAALNQTMDSFLLTHEDKKIIFFWDEAIWIMERCDLKKYKWVDYLICEALCPESMTIENWWKVDTKKICHITAKEAWKIGTKFSAKNLILIHTLEDIPWNRQEVLKEEARLEFTWNIFVPNQWDIIEII